MALELAGTAIEISTSVAMIRGTLIAKIHRHDALSTIQPPASGPTIAAIPPHAVHVPIAAPRWRGANVATITASELGTSSAPARPCRARAASRTPIVGAAAQASEKTPNALTPIVN